MLPITQVAIIGECMVELRQTNHQVEQGFGGDTLNTAIYLSRLTHSQGITTAYVTGLGKDPFSQDMLLAWQQEGIDTDMVAISPDKLPGIYAIETAADGERSFYYWRNDSAAKYWLRHQPATELAARLEKYGLIYLSGISLAILPEDCRQTLLESLRLCHQKGISIAFDNNYRPTLWGNAAEAQHWYSQILSMTDYAFLTFDDEAALWGDTQVAQTVSRSRRLGVKEIVIKQGGDACLVACESTQWSVAPEPIKQIIDTTAAGDSFSAGYLAARLLGKSCESSAQSAHRLAGLVIQHHGAIIPTQKMPEIESLARTDNQ
ncbi:2-dehydro-3-deoxygluconokinase [Vibrio ruber DSM 16370]|uniref:2-dehydro-3-deoxygluconokinase n=1 Tax=Vibrio ruber (strain DSM 16370 / JCM 11486 / BCRC 17186 / CECT 7878 / LMG 23124 / VR1) TaxID=1123498 RepID=A0A1R4LGR2_VIBR1|nr:sugar kinase [Vibrio ruber]SJN55730.1 2-dehydro-3-deoxygluconokinase [Vibrio ruber DSM 16370]